jgi:hypothetical protein
MRGGLRMATIERNAEACEAALSARCECACKGQFHGLAHTKKWMREIFVAAQKAQAARLAATNKKKGKK